MNAAIWLALKGQRGQEVNKIISWSYVELDQSSMGAKDQKQMIGSSIFFLFCCKWVAWKEGLGA